MWSENCRFWLQYRSIADKLDQISDFWLSSFIRQERVIRTADNSKVFFRRSQRSMILRKTEMRNELGAWNCIKFGELTSQRELGTCLRALDAGAILIVDKRDVAAIFGKSLFRQALVDVELFAEMRECQLLYDPASRKIVFEKLRERTLKNQFVERLESLKRDEKMF